MSNKSKNARKKKQNARKAKQHVDHTRRLPTELLQFVFDLLDSSTVFCAGRVCRRWREIAQAHWNYCASILLDSDDWENPDAAVSEGLRLAVAMNRARAASLCIDLSVRFLIDFEDEPVYLNSASVYDLDEPISDDEPHSDCISVLNEIATSFSSLVHLKLTLHEDFFEFAMKTLGNCQAPRLRSLVFTFLDSDGHAADGPTLHPALFSGSAPFLHYFGLYGVQLPYVFCPALSGVRSAELGISDDELSRIVSTLPRLRDLVLHEAECFGNGFVEMLRQLGPQLQSLELHFYVRFPRHWPKLDHLLYIIPDVRIVFETPVDNPAALLYGLDSLLDVRLSRDISESSDKGMSVLDVSILSTKHRFSMCINVAMEIILIKILGRLSGAMKSLNVSHEILPLVVPHLSALPALALLTIDVRLCLDPRPYIHIPEYDSYFVVRTPNLAVVCLRSCIGKARLTNAQADRMISPFDTAPNVSLPRLMLEDVELYMDELDQQCVPDHEVVRSCTK